jgi:cobalt-zinc-cadmium resistance protein CzcA
MLDKIILFSIKNKFVIGLFTLALVLWGIYSLSRLPIDALPDITNNQVQIITSSPRWRRRRSKNSSPTRLSNR